MATKEKQDTRREKGEALYEAGAVTVLEEWLGESAPEGGCPEISGGRYEVGGSGGRSYEVTARIPDPASAPSDPDMSEWDEEHFESYTCLCEDHRRGNAPLGLCKHIYAVQAHITAANADMAARIRAIQRHKAEKATAGAA